MDLVKSLGCTGCRTDLLCGSDGFAAERSMFTAWAFTCCPSGCKDFAKEAAVWALKRSQHAILEVRGSAQWALVLHPRFIWSIGGYGKSTLVTKEAMTAV